MKRTVEIVSMKSLFQLDLPSKRAGGFRNAIYAGGRPHVALVGGSDWSTRATARRRIKADDRDGKTMGDSERSLTSQVLQRTEANITDQTSLITRLIKSSLSVYDKRATISSLLPILRLSTAPTMGAGMSLRSQKYTSVSSTDSWFITTWYCESLYRI